jgi:hypothetical protein
MSGPHAEHLHELPERLRVFADNEGRCGRFGQQQELVDAADEIERLRRRVEDLETKTRQGRKMDRSLTTEELEAQVAAFAPRRAEYMGARFAPGDYLCRCHDCQDVFQGDKLAGRCFPCATALINHEAENAETDDGSEDLPGMPL